MGGVQPTCHDVGGWGGSSAFLGGGLRGAFVGRLVGALRILLVLLVLHLVLLVPVLALLPGDLLWRLVLPLLFFLGFLLLRLAWLLPGLHPLHSVGGVDFIGH